MAPRTAKSRATAVGKARTEERRRKDPQADATREEQKRARNRLAQKAIRERTTAHIRHLEHQLAASQRSTDTDRLQEVLDENAKLRDGLRAARKKLFSIATTVTTLANNIGPLLHLDNPAPASDLLALTQNSGRPQSRSPSCDDTFIAVEGASTSTTEFTESPINIHEIDDDLTISLGDDGPSYDSQSAPVWSDSFIDGSALENGGNAFRSLECRQIQALCSVSGTSGFIGTPGMADCSSVLPENEIDITSNFLNLNDPSWLNIESPQYNPSQSLLRRYSHSQFSDHLDFIQKLLQQNGYAESHSSSPPKIVESMLREFIKQCWPAMGPWFAITDAYDTVKNVSWWKVTRSSQALSSIQISYMPTWIQQTLQYPSIIDWIPYPRIRDRLILNLEAYDIDQIICDMTESYMIERINPLGHTPQTCNLLDLVQWSLQVGIDPYNSYPLSSTPNISRDAWCKKSIPDRAVTIFYNQLPKPFRIPGFKIHPNFFKRYPSLYDPSAMAENTTNITTSALRLQKGIPLSQKIADSYIKVLIQAKDLTQS